MRPNTRLAFPVIAMAFFAAVIGWSLGELFR